MGDKRVFVKHKVTDILYSGGGKAGNNGNMGTEKGTFRESLSPIPILS